ncbi:MAG: hypothetical protein ACI8TA_003636 [Cyclobacteriaceae bacterium]|jgi:hypothetical protein
MRPTLTILILSLTTFLSSGQTRPTLPADTNIDEEVSDSTLINYPYYEILLVRYLPTLGEFGGTTDSIRIFRSNECPDTLKGRALHCKILRASLTSVEQAFGYDTTIVTEGSRVNFDSVKIDQPIHLLINQAIDEVYVGAKDVYNGEMRIWGKGYFEISMGFTDDRYKDFNLASNRTKGNWESFEKLKKIITLANNK